MFARVSQARYPPEHHDTGMRVLIDELMPSLRRAPGYRGCYLLADGKPGIGLAVVLWDTEECCRRRGRPTATSARPTSSSPRSGW